MELQEALLDLIREDVVKGWASKGRSNGVDCSVESRVGRQSFRLEYENEGVTMLQ